MDVMTPLKPKILIIEDDTDTATIMADILCDHFQEDCVRYTDSIANAAQENLAEIDLVICDYNLPDGNGLDALKILLKGKPDLPVIVVTGENEISIVLQAIKSGAYDYVVKSVNALEAIPLTVEKNLAVWRIKQENILLQNRLEESLAQIRESNEQLASMIERLEEMALTDPLTGLSNRRRLTEMLSRMFAVSSRYKSSLSCIMIDLDGFKEINDTEGHLRGDELLCLTSKIIKRNCRAADIAARYGGDEFVVLLPQTDRDTAANLAERLYSEFIKTVLRFEGKTSKVTLSLGIASTIISKPANGEQLIAHADRALYAAKKAGKGQIMLCESDGHTFVGHQVMSTGTPFESVF